MAETRVVLIVEDDPEALRLLSRFFERNCYRVLSATNPIDALALMSDSVDIVVTDFDMPIMNGADLRQMLCHAHPHIPVVGITGLKDIGNLRAIFDDGLTKPFRLSALLVAVERLMSGLFCVSETGG